MHRELAVKPWGEGGMAWVEQEMSPLASYVDCLSPAGGAIGGVGLSWR